jgi:hypothetical protein
LLEHYTTNPHIATHILQRTSDELQGNKPPTSCASGEIRQVALFNFTYSPFFLFPHNPYNLLASNALLPNPLPRIAIRPCQILSCRYTTVAADTRFHDPAWASLPQSSRYGFRCSGLVNYVQRRAAYPNAAAQPTIDGLQRRRWMSGFLRRYL